MGLLNRWSKKKEQEQLDLVRSSASDTSKTAPEQKQPQESPAQSFGDAGKKKSARFVLLHPIVSEKASLAESQGIYTFAVSLNATKIDITFAVKEQYGIIPKRVSVICMEGKRLRFGRNRGRRSDWKKAIVSLPKGQTIHVHEGV